MQEFTTPPLHSSHMYFDSGGNKSSMEPGFSSPHHKYHYTTARRASLSVSHQLRSPNTTNTSWSSVISTVPSLPATSSSGPQSPRRPISVDVLRPVRSFSGPLHSALFTPDAPIYEAHLHLSTAQSDAGISPEPEILARHKACVQKGSLGINKSNLLEMCVVPRSGLQASFSWELELLGDVLSRVETRPRIGARSNGFRVESKAYGHLLRVLTSRRCRAMDGFALNGRKPPVVPCWGDNSNLNEFYKLTDFEILAVCFRAEVEHFLFQLGRFYDFPRHRPRRVPRAESRDLVCKSNQNSPLPISRPTSCEFNTTSARSSKFIRPVPLPCLEAHGAQSQSLTPAESILQVEAVNNNTRGLNYTQASSPDAVFSSLILAAPSHFALVTMGPAIHSPVESAVTEVNTDVQRDQAALQITEGSANVPPAVAHILSAGRLPSTVESLRPVMGRFGPAITSVRHPPCDGIGMEQSSGYTHIPWVRLALGIG